MLRNSGSVAIIGLIFLSDLNSSHVSYLANSPSMNSFAARTVSFITAGRAVLDYKAKLSKRISFTIKYNFLSIRKTDMDSENRLIKSPKTAGIVR